MRIICLHQSSDLYGSDRSFLQVLRYFKDSEKYTNITVILPRDGPLAFEIQTLGIQVIYWNLSLLSKTYLMKLQFGKILMPLLQFQRKLRLLNSYDIVYVNTSVILDFYVLGSFIRRKKFIHIREIPTSWLSRILTVLIRRTKAVAIFNSEATRASFGLIGNSVVLHNAIEDPLYYLPENVKYNDNSSQDLNLLLIGRINDWKGQDFVIDTLKELNDTRIKLTIVGSTSIGNEKLVQDLKDRVALHNLQNQVTFLDFIDNTEKIYNACDLVVVPSKKPEPFGRIAIEAMRSGKPVIAACHGGLTEIITNDFDGLFFKPNDMEDFKRCLSIYLNQRHLLSVHGKNAFETFRNRFSIETFNKRLDEIFK